MNTIPLKAEPDFTFESLKYGDVFDAVRARLRERFLVNRLLDPEQPVTIVAEFSGSGDSGAMDSCTINDAAMNLFLDFILSRYVPYDWFNNDGGGGTITWDLVEDTILIEGYVNVLQQISQADVEL